MAQENPPRIHITVKKPRQVAVGQSHNIHVHFESMQNLDSVYFEIDLPPEATLHAGQLRFSLPKMHEHQQLHRSYQLAFSDTLRGYIQIKAESFINGQSQTDYRHLFVYGYANTVEMMNMGELSTDQGQRIWKTQPLPPETPVVPLSYQRRFIQLQPGIANDTSYSLESVPNAPFYTIIAPNSTNSPDEPPSSNDLSKIQSTTSVTTTVSGDVRFKDSNGSYHPLVNARIELYDDDGDWGAQVLGTTVTNASGHFSKTVSGNDWWDSDIEVYGLIKTVNDKVRVLAEYPGAAFLPYAWSTPTTHTSGNDIDWGQISINSGSYSACTIFHRMNESWNFTATHGYDPGLITTIYPDLYEDWSYFDPSDEHIFIKNSHWLWNYYEDIPRHEYGHALMYRAQDGWWPDYNSPDEHYYNREYNPGLAWVEGWAHAYTQFVETDGNTVFNKPIENIPLEFPEGYENEARVGAAISDLYDSHSDGDDHILLDYSTLLSVIQNHHIDNLHDYWYQLKDNLSGNQQHYGSRALIFNTIDIPLVPYVELSVSIAGPSLLSSNQTGTFSANPSGGQEPYINYQWWERNDEGGILPLGDIKPNALPPGEWIAMPQFEGEPTINVGRTYDFSLRVKVTDSAGDVAYAIHSVGVGGLGKSVEGNETKGVPAEYAVQSNFPNPFNPTTTIQYQLPTASHVSVVVYNVQGQTISRLVHQKQTEGYYSVVWDGENEAGERVSSGT